MGISGDEFPRHCSFCMKNFTDTVSAKQHFESGAHKKKEVAVRRTASGDTASSFTCYVCSITCNSTKSLEEHKSSKRHRNMVLKNEHSVKTDHDDLRATNDASVEEEGNLPLEDEAVEEVLEEKEYDFDGGRGYCYICKIDLTSIEQATRHLNGSKHRKAYSNFASEETREQLQDTSSKESEKLRPLPNSSENEDILYCKICDFRADSLYTIIDHLKSSEHDTNVVNRSIHLFMSVSGLELGRRRCNDPLVNAVYSSLHEQVPQQSASANQQMTLSGTVKQTWKVEPMSEHFKEMSELQNKSEEFFNTESANIDVASLLSEESAVSYRTAEEMGKEEIYERQFAAEDSKMGVNPSVDYGENQQSESYPMETNEYDQNASKSEENNNVKQTQRSGNTDGVMNFAMAVKSIGHKTPAMSYEALKNKRPDFTFDKVSDKGHCNVCDVEFNSKHVMDQHLNGRKHKNAKAANQTAPSQRVASGKQLFDICLVPVSDPEAQEVNLNKNRKKLELKSGNNDNKPTGFICALCNIECSGGVECRNHLIDGKHMARVLGFVSGQIPRKCEICNYVVNTLEQLVIHQRAHHPEKFRHTSDIGTSNVNLESLADVTVTKPGVYFCKICEVECRSESSVTEHCLGQKHRKKLLRMFAEDKNDKPNISYCAVCEVECSSEDNFKEHILGQKHKKKMTKFETNKPGVFFCDLCNVECSSENNLMQHLIGEKHRKKLLKGELGILFCKICKIECSCKVTYKEHLLGEKHRKKLSKFETDTPGVYYCDVCELACAGENSFIQHFFGEKHEIENIKPNVFFCAVCNLECTNEENYKQHMMGMKHRKKLGKFEGDKAGILFCDVCNAECSGENSLVQHLLGEEHRKKITKIEIGKSGIFFCHLCNVDCMGENSYNQHLLGKSHKKKMPKGENDRPDVFYCVVCKMECPGEDNFKLHIGGEKHRKKAYQLACECEICNTKFNTQEELSVHQSVEHPEIFKTVSVVKRETFDKIQTAMEDESGAVNAGHDSNSVSNVQWPFTTPLEDFLSQEMLPGHKEYGSSENDNMSAG